MTRCDCLIANEHLKIHQRTNSCHLLNMSEEAGGEEGARHLVMEHQQSDYERLRDQCLSAMSELETLRRRHAEILNRCEMSAQEADYFRKQNKGLMVKCKELTKEHQLLQVNFEQVVADRNRLRQDYEEIVLLREQEKLETSKISKTSSFASTVNYEQEKGDKKVIAVDDLQKEHEELQDSHDDLRADHDLLSSKYKKLEEENQKGKEQYDMLLNERDSLAIERNTLKHQCAHAIRGYEKALRDRDESAREVMNAKQQFEIAAHELSQANKVKLQMSLDIIKLQEDRNSALHEYKLVMSERDTVHQEIEKLQDDLGQTKDEAKKLVDDKEKVFLEKEGLRHEIVAVLADRDVAMKEAHDLRIRLQTALKEKEKSAKRFEEQMQAFEMLKQERNAAKKERGEAIVHRDKILKECFEVKRMFENMASGKGDEKEGLTKKFNKLSTELTNAWHIAELAMTRRDFAFSERDRVVRELEELKENYAKSEKVKSELDKKLIVLTSERDIAQRRYTEIIQEVQHHQRNSLVTSNVNNANLLCSQDSAIDTESPSYHIETVELERASKDEEFGFRIGGGIDQPLSPHDASIFVTQVIPGSTADNKLKVHDCIIRVNNIDVTNVHNQEAYEAIYGANYLNITFLRQSKVGVKSPLQRIEIKSSEDKCIGLSIDSGLHIKRIEPGSAASEEETLSIGDKILSANGQSIENMPYQEAKKLLKTSNLSLTVLKPSVSTTSSHRSLQQNIDDDKTDLNDKRFNDVAVAHHLHCISAPVHIRSNTEQLLMSINHFRSSSVTNQASDEELKRILAKLRKEDEEKRTASEINEGTISPHRSASFIAALKKDPVALLPNTCQTNPYEPHRRPASAHGSKQSVASSSSTSRYSLEFGRNTPSSPRNICRSDPLALSPRTVGQSSATNSSTSVNSSGRLSHGRKRLSKPCYTVTSKYLPQIQSSHQDVIPERPMHSPITDMFGSHSNSFQHGSPAFFHLDRVYNTFPGKQKASIDVERYPSHTGMNISKPNSSRSVGYYKSCSSHGSVNSSELSDKAVSTIISNIEPVHEETVESLQEFSMMAKLSVTSPRSSGRSSRQESTSSPNYSRRHPSQSDDEEPREIVIEKGQYPLGITIAQGQNKGIFVAGVNDNSIASRHGLKYGDQLLQYNGLNLRNANYNQAVLVLKQSSFENTVTVLVQYNPDKLHENITSTHSTPCTQHRAVPTSPLYTPSLSKSGSRNGVVPGTLVSMHTRLNSNASSSSTHSKHTSNEIKITPIPEDDPIEDPRLIRIDRNPPSTTLGIGIIGGNAMGVFISDIQKDSLSDIQPGLKCGDQILKYNGKEMRGSKLEEATLELLKPTEVADFLVQYNPPGYLKVQSEPGDSFYIRVFFDRSHPPKGELPFRKGDMLHVTDTLYKGQLGVWRAMIVSDRVEGDEHKQMKGKIPSKGKAEQELLLRRSSTYGDDKLKGRKSLFRLSKKGKSHAYSVNHSRESSDSKADIEIASTISSGTSLGFCSDSDLTAYQYVKRYDSNFPRPVVVIGAMAEPICDKLVVEYNKKFVRCLPEINESTKDVIEMKISDGTYIDYKLLRKGDRFECSTSQAIKEVIYGKSKHCLLDINYEAIDKLIPLQLHPIVIFLKYKSLKQIKDLKEGHYIRDKISSKAAKDLFELYSKVEKDHKQSFTAVLCVNSNLNNICKDVLECVQEQQKKILWVHDE